MALNRTKLADIAYIASTAASVYANPASTKTYIRALILYNNNTTTEVVELHNVPDSSGSLGTAGVANKFLKINLVADETLFLKLDYPIVLTDTNDALFAKTTTASKVTIQLQGDKDA